MSHNFAHPTADNAMLMSCRHRFPALDRSSMHGIRVFADNSSRAQMPDISLNAVMEQLINNETHRGGYPDWDSKRAEPMQLMREQARQVAAAFCHGHSSQIGFAANGTSTLAVLACAMFGTVLNPGDKIVITEADHDANRAPWLALRKLGCVVIDVPVSADGGLDMSAWYAALAQGPKVVAYCMLSNVTGVILPYAALAKDAHEAGSIVVLDAVQGPPHGHTDVMHPEIDVAIFSNCKLFSPHLGWWAIRHELMEKMNLSPSAGNHPRLEWGSFSHVGYAGFVATHKYFCSLTKSGDLASAMTAVRQHEGIIQQRFLNNLSNSLRNSLLAAESDYPRVPIFSLPIPRKNWASVLTAFETAEIDVRIGQFGCPATLNRLANETDGVALRLSFVHYNTIDDVDAVCEILNHLERRLS